MIGIARGMATTLRHFLRPAITEQYPHYRRELPERARMGFALDMAEDGSPKCRACLLCERSCPDDAITITSDKRVDGPGKVLTSFSIDLGRCMYCGLCVEQCSFDGLRHTGDFEHAVTSRAETVLVLYRAEPGEAAAVEDVSPAELREVADTFGHAGGPSQADAGLAETPADAGPAVGVSADPTPADPAGPEGDGA